MSRHPVPRIQERPARQSALASARTAFHDLPDDERRRRLLEAIHRELGHPADAWPALLSEDEVARILKRSVGTLRNRRWAGHALPRHIHVGRSVLYEPVELVDFLLAGTPRRA